MPKIKNCEPLAGRHWETGSLRNALACRGAVAPHTGEPYSEALLLGVSGGITFGYFTFEYTGHLPHVALLTRNTFSPVDTILERLAIPHEVRQTVKAEQGHANLMEALDSGYAPLVWVDFHSLPYNALGPKPQTWLMVPVLVYGYDGDTFLVADRSRKPFHVSAETLTQARGRVKQDRFRLMTLEPPDAAKLPAAVQKGIWQCLSLYTEAPPKGARHNFGLAAFQHWAKLLAPSRNKAGWQRQFAPGPRLMQALAGTPRQPGAYAWLMHYWVSAAPADRGLYADFLDDAAVILKRPALKQAAEQFRATEPAWTALAEALLPRDVPLLYEARTLQDKRHRLFIEKGEAALDEITQIHARLDELMACAKEAFPLTAAQADELLAAVRQKVLAVHDAEQQAVAALQAAMA